jgi:hypothetical protein
MRTSCHVARAGAETERERERERAGARLSRRMHIMQWLSRW